MPALVAGSTGICASCRRVRSWVFGACQPVAIVAGFVLFGLGVRAAFLVLA